jgi:protein subunit release factor B
MVIRPEKMEAIEKEMMEFGILEEDLIEKFILGSGPGGQKINTTHSTVYLKHVPTGIEVKCQKERSREGNRYQARKELLEKFKSQICQIETKKTQEMEKIRRQKKRRSRKAKIKMIEEKKKRGEVKEARKGSKLE